MAAEEGGHKPHGVIDSVFEGIDRFDAGHTLLEMGSTLKFGGMEQMLHHGLGLTAGAAEMGETISSGVGGALGAISFGKGVGELINARGDLGSKEGSQGGLDVISGGLGMATLACPALAPVTAAAGLAAFGNEYSESHGWYGQHTGADGKQENETFFGGIGHGAQEGWEFGHQIAGDGLAGHALGAVAGGLDATGHAVWNTGAAIAGAGARIGEGIGSAASWAGDKIGGAWDSVTDW